MNSRKRIQSDIGAFFKKKLISEKETKAQFEQSK
jgi:hypothetical protein